jgi:hypothetical protein
MFDTNNIMENGSGVGGVGGVGAGGRPPSAPNSGNHSSPQAGGLNPTVTSNNNTTPSKAAIQMQKMRDANTKYKNLLKMAKERIEQQEEELKKFKGG